MFGLYTPLLLLQAFCIYHAYKHNVEQRWYWLIIFFPGIGCLVYLYDRFYNRSSIQNISQGVKEVVNSNYRIEQLEKALRFADNISNKINLADAYVHVGRYTEAIQLYKDCLNGFMADDPTLRMKIIQASFLNQDYATAVAVGNELLNEKTFKSAESRIAYAWSLHFTGQSDVAEKVFDDMNKTFTNYRHRLEYCKFLKGLDKQDSLRELLQELLDESEHMKGPEKRLHRNIFNEIREVARTVQKP